MDEKVSKPTPVQDRTIVERRSDQEAAVTRIFNAPAHIVFAAWTRPELFKQWWVPKSFGLSLLSCEMNVCVGGRYRLEFGHLDLERPMAFFGRYTEVVSNARLAWTNEESNEGFVTTVTFEEQGGKTILKVHDLYPSKEALDGEIASGATAGMRETLDQLEAFIVTFVSS